MKIILTLFCLLFCLGRATGQAEKVTAFSFETFTRGYHKTITIRADSIFIQEQNQPSKNIQRKTKSNEWANPLQAIAGYQLTELTDLPAPTNDRARDAARSSSITIKTNRKTYASGSFDNQKPHAKLERLMGEISRIADPKL